MAGTPAASSVSGLRAPAIFSSTQVTSRSYLRFYNAESTGGTVEVTLANADTGAVLGVWTSPNIPAGALLQYFIRDIEDAITPAFAKPPFYSLSIRPTFAGYFQHVLWQLDAGTLTNLSTCDTGTTTDPKLLISVHSSLTQSGYPSTVVVHNTGSTNVNVSLGIYDARNNTRIATVATGTLQPNAQKIATVAEMEATAHVAPGAGMYRYIIKPDTSFSGYLQHLVNNTASGLITDMTAVCRLAP